MSATPPVTQTATPPGSTGRGPIRTLVAASVGTVIEWYDYGLYAIVAGLVITPLFFPAVDATVGLLATFATFAVGFIARPIGGIVLGALSDRWGRRPVLVLSIVMIGISTTLIGLLPDYATIGVWAPILLILLRLTQGFGAGAELAGAITLLNESATRRRKGFYASFAMGMGLVGSILSTLLFAIISAVSSPADFLAFGWRIPFLLSAVLTILGVLLRRRMDESPEFERLEQERAAGRLPEARRNPLAALVLSIKESPRNWIAGFLLPSGLNVTGFVLLAFGISYLTGTIGFTQAQSLTVNLAMLTAGGGLCMLWGQICDRIGARRVMLIGIVVSIVLAYPYFLLLQSGSFPLVVIGSVLLFVFAWSAGSAGHTVLMPALFKSEYRAAGLFSSRELQGALVAGPAPFIATALVAMLGGQPWLVVALVIVSQLMTLAGVLLGRPFVSAEEIAETPALQGVTPRD